MADLFLLNGVTVTTPGVEKATTYEAGSLITDEDIQALVTATGGILVPYTEALAAASARVSGANQVNYPPLSATIIMLSAASGATEKALEANSILQDTWYIVPSTGDDTNDGSLASPLATHVEFNRRLGVRRTLESVMTVNLPEGLPPSDPIELDINVDMTKGGGILYVGAVKDTLQTGTATSVTTFAASTNQPWTITDSALAAADTWTDYLDERIRITSGSNSGAIAWVKEDLGSKEAIVSNWAKPGAYPDDSVSLKTIVTTNPYAVETLQEVTLGKLNVTLGRLDFGQDNFPNVSFKDLHIVAPENGAFVMPNCQPDMRFYGCKVDPDLDCSRCTYVRPLSSSFGAVFLFGGGKFAPQAGTAAYVEINKGGVSEPDGNFLVYGDDFHINGGSASGSRFGVMNGHILVNNAGSLKISGGNYGTAAVWGQGGEFSGLMVIGGSTVVIGGFNAAHRFYITGDSGDFSLGSSGTDSGANLPGNPFGEDEVAWAFDPSTNEYGDPNTCTWANFLAAVGSGTAPNDGFGKAAVNPRIRTSIALEFA